MEQDCIFCKIVNGELPSTKIFESKRALAFLDIFPQARGHVLVVPKKHSKNLLDASEKDFAEIMAAMQKVGAAQMKALGAQGFNVLQSNNAAAGQVVFHTHFHVVPRKSDDGKKFGWQAEKADEKYLKEVGSALKKSI